MNQLEPNTKYSTDSFLIGEFRLRAGSPPGTGTLATAVVGSRMAERGSLRGMNQLQNESARAKYSNSTTTSCARSCPMSPPTSTQAVQQRTTTRQITAPDPSDLTRFRDAISPLSDARGRPRPTTRSSCAPQLACFPTDASGVAHEGFCL